MTRALNILVLDDDGVDRGLIKRQLRQIAADKTVHEASTAADGFAILRDRAIDCVLLDYRLPDKNGLAVLADIKRDPDTAPAVVMLTGVGNESIAVSAMKGGAEDYLTKIDRDPSALWNVITSAVAAVDKRRRDEEIRDRYEEMALTDPVTGIGSRHLFEMRFAHAIDRVKRQNSGLALLVMDLDGFKGVNDTLGHQLGDDVLRVIGQRMQSAIRGSDTVARLGGDEYVVIMETGVTREGARFLAERIRTQVTQPIAVEGQQAAVGISIGVALYPEDGDSADDLIEAADAAMYAEKKSGRAPEPTPRRVAGR